MKKILFLLLIITTLSQAQARDISLVLPWKHQFQFAGYYVAKEMGFYEKVGLKVHIKEYDLKRDNAKDVSNMKYDFGIGHSSIILDKINKYPNLKFLAVIHQSSPMTLISKKRSDIKTLEDIAGKTIMMSSDQANTASINAMLFSQDFKENSYEVVETSFNPVDLINGNADLMLSYSSNEPFVLEQKGIKYTIFDPKNYGYDFYSDILFTSSQMIDENPDVVKAFYKATLEGWLYAYSHIDYSIDIISNNYNTQNRDKKALEFEAKTLKKLAFKKDMNFGDINPIRLKEITTAYRLLGLVKQSSVVDFNDFIYYTGIEKVVLTNEMQKKDLLKKFYYQYQRYIQLFIFIFISIFLIAIYIRYKLKLLLKQKSEQLAKQHKIFDENISSSRTDIDGTIISVSKAFCDMSGYSENELLGKNHRILKQKNNPKEIYQDLWKTISNGNTWSDELKNVKKDGEEYWIKVIISPIFDKDKKIIAYDAIGHDITLKKFLLEFNKKLDKNVQEKTSELKILNQNLEDRIKQEVEKNRQKDKALFQQSKLASMGEMISNIAHQWRQPLNRMNLSLEVIVSILKNEIIDKQMIENKIRSSQKNLHYMSNTIEDFSNFFRPDKQILKFNIQKLINILIGVLGNRLNQVEFIYDKKDVYIESYESEILQVFLIIINNALDNFEIKNIPNPQIKFLLSIDTNHIEIDIIDNGGGIPQENIDKIFDPYFTTKFKNEGTGIGLYMAKMIVEDSMDGELSVTSNTNNTTFRIGLTRIIQ